MARRIDGLGRIVIPVELRRLYGIRPGDALEISVDGDAIVLRKLERTCVFCSALVELIDFRGRWVCRSCASAVNPAGGDPAG
jgi:AbrB family transcriptional regulator, transcriptional pleiotropic regulator of transition state genes